MLNSAAAAAKRALNCISHAPCLVCGLSNRHCFALMISQCIAMQVTMVDPVIAADGHTYDRHAVEHWLQQYDTSPVTGKALSHKRLVPNQIVKRVIANDTRFK